MVGLVLPLLLAVLISRVHLTAIHRLAERPKLLRTIVMPLPVAAARPHSVHSPSGGIAMAGAENRRPLASRQTAWARRAARVLAATPITPNQISMLGMVAGLISGLCFWAAGELAPRWAFLLGGALFCQLRLLCNLLDGMVAIEAERASPDGGFWNEFPDRISDMLILMGVALGIGLPALGWAAVSFAFLTAYIRELGVNYGARADFSGPMAKPHRMALVTAAALLSLFEPLWDGHLGVLTAALWIITVGTAATALRRARRLAVWLRTQS